MSSPVSSHTAHTSSPSWRWSALAAVKAKAEFVTNVSHEFRTPMAEILGAAEILTQIGDDPDGGVREEFSAIALHGAKRLARLAELILYPAQPPLPACFLVFKLS